MSRARDMANLGAQAGSGLDASDITTGTLGNTVQDNITRLGVVTTGTIKNTIHSDATFPAGTVVNVTTMRGSSGTTWDLDNVFTESSITNSQRYNTTNFFKVTPSKSGNTFVIIGNFPIGFNNASGGDAGLTLELGVTVGSGSAQYPSSLSTDGMLGNNHSIYQNSGSADFIFPFAHTYYYTTGSIDVHSFGINLKAYGINSISFNLYNNRAIVNVLEVQS